ncbi:MAG: hypothetical protein PSV22_05230, partial [Pseudolabrys sp.]|nr:hypothetical protein [Pseudolabrys sp.]
MQRNDAPECVKFGVRELERALAEAPASGHPEVALQVIVESLEQPALDAQRGSYEAVVPGAAESFAIRRTGDHILIIGRDAVGAMYGALAAAEGVRRSGAPA